MKIGIDARFLTHPQRGGFKTYTENLIAALGEVDSENEYILYLDRPPNEESKLPHRPNFAARIVPGLLPVVGMVWREQFGLARQVIRDRLDLFHAPSLTAPLRLACPLVVTIHDMIWFFAEKFSSGKPRSVQRRLMDGYYRVVPQLVVHRAAAILTVSQAAKNDIIQHLGLAPDQIIVTCEAASPVFHHIDDVSRIEKIRCRYDVNSPFILGIGSADSRKNIPTLIKAYSLLPVTLRAMYRLVIVWTHDLMEAELGKQVAQMNLIDDVRFVRQVTNEDLALLYNAASLFAFPSLYEGFGLPLLEAMACGTPIVTANNSSIPEIVDDAALLVEAKDAKAIADAIASVLTDEAIYATLKQRGSKRAAAFSWEKCARETLTAYRQVLLA